LATVTEFSDSLLLTAYCRGDRDAFDAIYRRYAPRIYATAYRLTGNCDDAEDTLQEVFMRLAREAASIRHGEALWAWLYRTTANRVVDLRRRRGPTIGLSLDAPTDQAARVIAIESLRRQAVQRESQRQDEMLREVGALIPRLTERQAAVFVLHGFQGLSHNEIAKILKCSEGCCRAGYSVACRRLREWIEQREEAENRKTRKAGKNA